MLSIVFWFGCPRKGFADCGNAKSCEIFGAADCAAGREEGADFFAEEGFFGADAAFLAGDAFFGFERAFADEEGFFGADAGFFGAEVADFFGVEAAADFFGADEAAFFAFGAALGF